jgi:hypothetical protein
MKAIIDSVTIEGTMMEIIQYKEMVDARKKIFKHPQYIVHFPAGLIPSPSDASVYGQQLNNKINKYFGNQY